MHIIIIGYEHFNLESLNKVEVIFLENLANLY